MDQKLDILERKDLRRNPYTVPEGYFDRLQKRLSAIPQQENLRDVPWQELLSATPLQERLCAIPRQEATPRTRIRPVLAFATGIAAALAAVLLLVSRPGALPDDTADFGSYEQFAYADLIPHTDPYIYSEVETAPEPDPAEEEMLDYLMQSRIINVNE